MKLPNASRLTPLSSEERGWGEVELLFRFIGRGARSGSQCAFRARGTLHAFLLAGIITCLSACAPPTNRLDSKLFDHVEIIGTRGVGIGQLNKPRSVAVDRQDNLYVVDMTGRVQKFSPAGQFQLLWQMPQTDLGKPKGMGRDPDGNIIVIEPHYQRVNYFSPEGKLLAQWGEKGTNAGQLIMPRAAAVNSRGETFISEYGAVERVQKFAVEPIINTRLQPGVNENGNGTAASVQRTNVIIHPRLIACLGHAGTGPGEFNRPEGLCIDAQDRLYVADSCNHRIQIFSSEGKFLRMYGRPGKDKGELSYPYDICVDAAGRQYVCEFGNSRIQVFDANDQPIEIIGGPGAAPGRFSNPWSIALDSAENLYVADSQNHRVQKLIRKASVNSRSSVVRNEGVTVLALTFHALPAREPPISLTPRFSGVGLLGGCSATVSTVSRPVQKLLKQFRAFGRLPTPLKQGVNERRSHLASQGYESSGLAAALPADHNNEPAAPVSTDY